MLSKIFWPKVGWFVLHALAVALFLALAAAVRF